MASVEVYWRTHLTREAQSNVIKLQRSTLDLVEVAIFLCEVGQISTTSSVLQ